MCSIKEVSLAFGMRRLLLPPPLPCIDMPEGDVEFQPADAPAQTAPPQQQAASSSSDFMYELFAPHPTTDDCETEAQQQVRKAMQERHAAPQAEKDEKKRKAEEAKNAERERKRQLVNSFVPK